MKQRVITRAPLGAAVLTAFACSAAAHGQEMAQLDELRGLTIEQLANLEVTSVSRRAEPLSTAPAAIDVITNDDIRRSGAQTLPEVLRLARNLEVARIDAQRWAISARGFNSFEASNKLLVLIDGRTVYTPLYSGVFWDQQHVILEDIERIEVISGPGGTLWGANAVNGVINVITRSSAETQGARIAAFAGERDQRLEARYGGRIGDLNYRVFANGFQQGASEVFGGGDAGDDWSGAEIGFRTDWGSAENQYMLQASLYDNDIDTGGAHSGGHILGNWVRLFEDGSSFEAQAYYSNAERETAFINAQGVSDVLSTWDLSFQHNLGLGAAHEIVWGGGYRLADSEFVNTLNPFTFLDERRTLRTANLFVQDEIALRDALSLTVGIKLEDHTFTDLEYMPNARLAWRPNDRSMLWAAVSRAVRTPSRIDFELQFPGVIIPGGFESEVLLAYEVGYRSQPTDYASFSINLYYHDYEKLRTSSLTPPGVLPARIGNGLSGEVYGLEAWGDFSLSEDWRLSAGATVLEQEFRTQPFASDVNGSGDDPSYQLFLRSRMDLSDDLEFDLALRAIDGVTPVVPAYEELGARLGWRVSDNVELALVGENLLDERHPESIDGVLREVARSVHVTARLTY
jgi:iron complex outermembrane receptor protein